MTKRQRITSRVGLGLIGVAALVVALGLGMLPTQAWAVVDCAPFLVLGATDPGTDSDNDGFTDFQECKGITLNLGSLVTTIPRCGGTVLPGSTERRACVDPDTKDLFVALVPSTPSLLPAGAFDPLFNPSSPFDPFAGLIPLGVIPHAVPPQQLGSNRQVTSASPQKAIKVTESQATSQDYLGICNYGSPNDLDGCFVYTLKAQTFIDSVCNSAGDTRLECRVYVRYWTWIIQHEAGHSLGGLVIPSLYNARFGGYHYKCGSNVIMEQCVTYSSKGGKVTWYIPSTAWTSDDKVGLTLK